MSGSIASSVMVGRSAELDELRGAFRAGREGRPRVVVIRGEAGIGKTRLLQEFRHEAERVAGEPPVVFAVGQCVEVGSIGAPFTPVRRLLRELYDGVGDEAFRAAARSPVVLETLRTLVPELADRAGGSGAGDSGSTASVPGVEYVTEAVERIIEGLSAEHHLVLVIEDLHWADTATLDLLKTLAVTLRGTHVTVIMTYRSDDVGRTHPLRPVLAELDRSRVVTGLELKRLSLEEATVLARQVSAGASPDDVAAIVARSEGVPFFVEELAELDGAELPDTLRTIVLARYERLSDAARDVVGALSAGGVHVDHSTLERVHDRSSAGDPVDLDAGLREALSANVIVAAGEGYAFRHALIQEVVHDDLLPSVRSGLHRRYAAVIQERVDRGETAEATTAAEHWLAAREVERAFDATATARAHAIRGAATTTAALLGERLLDLWPQVPDAADRVGIGAGRLTAEIADEWINAGDMDRALRVARAVGLGAGDAVGEGHTLLTRARALGNSGRIVESVHEAERAAAILEATDDPAAAPPLARALALIALNIATSDVPEWRGRDVDAIFTRAAHVAEAAGDPDALVSCTLNHAWVRIDRGDGESALEAVRSIAISAASPAYRLNARNTEIDTLVRLARYREAVQIGDSAVQEAVEVGLERGFGSYIASNVGEALLAIGEPDRALPILSRARDLLTRSPAFQSFVIRQLVLHQSWHDLPAGSGASRTDVADAVRDGDAEEFAGWTEVDIDLALNSVDPADAAAGRDAVHTALSLSSALAGDLLLTWPGRHRRLLPGVARTVAEADLLGIDSADLTTVRDALETAVAAQDAASDLGGVLALVAAERVRGERRDSDEQIAAWRHAVRVGEAEGALVRHVHYERFRLAEALVAAGDRDEAALQLEQIVASAPAQGVALVARWARDLAERCGLSRGGDAAGSAAAHSAASVSSLTPRELQVLALVAEGLTNPQIGQRLFISPKTASVHVSAILAKIGAANRTEAAALYAALAPTPAP